MTYGALEMALLVGNETKEMLGAEGGLVAKIWWFGTPRDMNEKENWISGLFVGHGTCIGSHRTDLSWPARGQGSKWDLANASTPQRPPLDPGWFLP